MRFALCLVLVSLVLGGFGCTSQRIMNVNDTLLPTRADGSTHTMAEVQTAILQGCNQRGWAATVVSDGVIKASLRIRAYAAIVKIEYSPTAISILYEDSSNLHHHGDSIHRNYNRWVNNLYGAIMRNLGSRVRNF